MRKLLSAVFVCITMIAHAQYKNDNVLFKTVDPSQLAAVLKQNPGYLLLDVRSKGEHNDTSQFKALNIGRFKGARNIDIRELNTRWKEIEEYKDRPVFVYCSHSQRSRRASKMLADSGFTKVFNVNGGMTSFHYLNVKNNTDAKELFETSDAYSLISPQQLCEALKRKTDMLIDVRPDTVYNHTTSDAKLNSMGSFRSAVHIATNELLSKLETTDHNKRIILFDAFGNESVKAAELLTSNGFKNVSVLLEGTDRWLLTDPQRITCVNEYVSPVSYKIINPYEFGRWKKSYVALDVRSSEEFNNIHKDAFRNIGALNNAVNIPFDNLEEFSDQLQSYKNMTVLIYEFGGGKNAYAAAEALIKKRFKNVYVLAGGLFNLRWTAANMSGQKHLFRLVSGVPEENL